MKLDIGAEATEVVGGEGRILDRVRDRSGGSILQCLFLAPNACRPGMRHL